MNTIKVLAIAPYAGMADILNDVASEFPDIELTTRVGDLQEGVDIARQMFQNNTFDVVISRGGTAEALRSQLNVPVIEIQLSIYDILRCIKMENTYGSRYVITGFSGITTSARTLCDLLQLDTRIVTFNREEDVRPTLEKLKEEGYTLTICDMISSTIAQSIGMNAIFVSSSVESIRDVLNHVRQIIQVNSYLHLQRDLFKCALLTGKDSFLIYDPAGQLWYSDLTETARKCGLMELIQKYLPGILQHQKRSVVKVSGNIAFRMTGWQVKYNSENYTMIRAEETPAVAEEEDRSVLIFNDPSEIGSSNGFESNSSNLVGETQTLLEKYAATNCPVLITGEVGVGKEKAAALLYKYGKNQGKPYYIIDCSLMTERKWNTLLTSSSSPLNDVGSTIHIKDVGRLNTKELEKLYQFMDDVDLTKRNRVTFSLVTPDPETHDVAQKLMNHFSCLLLPLMPLRERLDDLPGIVMLYINEMNLELGKQIVGFDAKAFELIRKYSWPQNLDQFRRVLKELMVVTDAPYISAENVRKILSRENRLYGTADVTPPAETDKTDDTVSFDLNRSLSEIEKDIVKAVFEKEHQNREKTAKRLGISRTTLWRMLKEDEI